jgi:hypothetical protein
MCSRLTPVATILREAFKMLAILLALCHFGVASTHAQDAGAVFIRPEPTSAPTQLYRKSYALVIGIDSYTNGWQRLTNAVSDAQRVARILAEQGFDVRPESNLTGDELEKTIKEWFLLAGQDEDARLLVWIAGHGHTIVRPGVGNVNAYIVPADAPNPLDVPPSERREVQIDFLRKAFPLTRFGDLMRQSTARHILVIFDTCFAGHIFSAVRSAPPAISRDTLLPARQFITSGTAGQTVSDDGMFQRLFVDAITGKEPNADANKDGYVTANELGLFLQQKVTNLTRNLQTPDFGSLREEGYDRGDFVFSIPKQTTSPTPERPRLQASAEEQVWIFARTLANPAATELYISQYPDSPYRSVAEAQLKALRSPSEVVKTAAEAARIATAATKTQPIRAVSVLYGTDRRPQQGGFGASRDSILSFGRAAVTIPEAHRFGQIEAASPVKLFGLTL